MYICSTILVTLCIQTYVVNNRQRVLTNLPGGVVIVFLKQGVWSSMSQSAVISLYQGVWSPLSRCVIIETIEVWSSMSLNVVISARECDHPCPPGCHPYWRMLSSLSQNVIIPTMGCGHSCLFLSPVIISKIGGVIFLIPGPGCDHPSFWDMLIPVLELQSSRS